MLTVPEDDFTPSLPSEANWIRGQLEEGGETGYRHWQIVVAFSSKKSLAGVRRVFGERGHYELTRSSAADSYVWKELTRVDGTQFELGERPFKRNSAADWDNVWTSAINGRWTDIPSDIRVRCYGNLRRINGDFAVATGMERTCRVFIGPTGTGKSRRAWDESGVECYPKDPRTKFWCGYRGEKHVVIDEFRGGIDVCHLLRWLDRYPVCVEIKGSSVPLNATTFWITSNVDVNLWYPELDTPTLLALKRRLTIEYFQ